MSKSDEPRFDPRQTTMFPTWYGIDADAAAVAKLQAESLASLKRLLEVSGFFPDTTAYRLAILIFHITKNNCEAFKWTAKEIARDPQMQRHTEEGDYQMVHPNSVARAAQQLRRAGIILQTNEFQPRCGLVHVNRWINWKYLHTFSADNYAAEIPPERPREQSPKRPPERPHEQPGKRPHEQPPEHLKLLYSFPSSQETQESSSTQEYGWEAAGVDLFECGVIKIRAAIEAAQLAGVSPDYVRQCIEFWRSTGGAFGPGGLVERLREAKPYAAPETLWPCPKPLTDREQKAYRLLAAVQEYGVAEQLSESQIRSRFETAARTDPETCRPDQVEMATKYGCPFDEREINRALFEARSMNQHAKS
ncbi:hypothetical protein [Blastopirellula marina]|uniref:Uncharacterized protein n=1 Tax=Blastopirellula marina TaxID=124 RepID=A0A2S8F7I3_9BACT|nr:hypothetical protein [Blastopirellula marina]PQO28117.1 hypothetical protein C5Y98_24735 [Blastopirellula marina]PTL41657.1 hypothetical protein C5Y97_24750 [Blastopirellula marina]